MEINYIEQSIYYVIQIMSFIVYALIFCTTKVEKVITNKNSNKTIIYRTKELLRLEFTFEGFISMSMGIATLFMSLIIISIANVFVAKLLAIAFDFFIKLSIFN